MPSPPPVITIDGPAASEKSSIARAMTWAVLDSGLDPTDKVAVAELCDTLALEYQVSEGRIEVCIAGHHLTDVDLNSDPVNRAVSHVARVEAVRTRLVAQQRTLPQLGGLVMEGRDIGSVVFPDSPFKYYIDASEEVREARRQAQGHQDQVAERDRMDSTRTTSPLVIPDGAEIIDNSNISLEEAVDQVLHSLAASGLSAAA